MTDNLVSFPKDQPDAWQPGDLYTVFLEEGEITELKIVRLKAIDPDDSGVYGLIDLLDSEHLDPMLRRCKLDELVRLSVDTRAAGRILEAARHLSRRVLLYEQTVKDLRAIQLDLELQLSQIREIEIAHKESMTGATVNLAQAMQAILSMLSAANGQNLEAQRRVTELLRKNSVHEKRYIVLTGERPPETGMMEVEAEEYRLLRHRLSSLEAIVTQVWCGECAPDTRTCQFMAGEEIERPCQARCGGQCHRDHEALWGRYYNFEGAQREKKAKGETGDDLSGKSV